MMDFTAVFIYASKSLDIDIIAYYFKKVLRQDGHRVVESKNIFHSFDKASIIFMFYEKMRWLQRKWREVEIYKNKKVRKQENALSTKKKRKTFFFLDRFLVGFLGESLFSFFFSYFLVFFYKFSAQFGQAFRMI